VLKEKIKKLKERLKTWNKDQFRDTFKKYKKIEGELNQLEVNLANRQLSLQQMIIKKQLQDLWIATQSHESLLRQKARVTWVKEGDCNSRFSHLLVNASRRNNNLNRVWINEAWIEEPVRVKEVARLFFLHRFQKTDQHRPRLDSIRF